MNHFLKLDVFAPVQAIQAELAEAIRQGLVLFSKSIRTECANSPHRESKDVWLRWNDTSLKAHVFDGLQCVPYSAWNVLHVTRNLVLDLMRKQEGVQLGRVMLTLLPDGAVIHPHADEGASAKFYQRYVSLIAKGPNPAIFRIGGEQVDMQPGEIWWVDNSTEHSVVNNSGGNRIALVVDIRED